MNEHMTEIMQAENTLNFINHDDGEREWKGWGVGDMDGPHGLGVGESVILDPATFPPGTKIAITVPVCPECEDPVECCVCGFDWKTWAEEQYQ